MTRQHYEKVAKIIKKFPSLEAILAKEFSELFTEDNPRFDEDRFYIACGVQVVMSSFENVARNQNRFRKVSGRKRTSWMDKMTPQGQAIYCAEFVENAAGFNPELELVED